jgi:hypothetical protein
MKYQITKLDRRHTGHDVFEYYVTPLFYSKLLDKVDYQAWRIWCWDTWGPGMERDLALEFGSNQYEVARWSWFHLTNHKPRLYFRTQKEFNWFHMKWGTE